MATRPQPPVVSGASFQSGFPASTGSPGGTGYEWWGAFTIGEGVSRPGAIPFHLAPRLYVLSRGMSDRHTASGETPGSEPYDELPVHLIFRESPVESGEQTHQSWVSETGSDWIWELIVERSGAAIQATLTATPAVAAGRGDPPVWKSRGGWEAFGMNDLTREPNADGAPSLYVAVP